MCATELTTSIWRNFAEVALFKRSPTWGMSRSLLNR